MEEEDYALEPKKSETPHVVRGPVQKIIIPKREPSVVIPGRQIIYITPDKTTCVECPCYPKEDPYAKPKKLNPCQHSPLTLMELAAKVLDSLQFPPAFQWTVQDAANWMEEIVGFPQYKECIQKNHINGMRLLMLEDPSKLPEINIHYFEHIKTITSHIRKLYAMDFIRFVRSVGLPPRRPLVHCTWFKSRTGPSWGIRKNWTRSNILRWMKILLPEPLQLDHWDLVWYQTPDFPKVLYARVHQSRIKSYLPRYKPSGGELEKEYQVPRKFRLQTGIRESEQKIWMERRPGSPLIERKPELKKKFKFLISEQSRLIPKKISLKGLKGKDLILARRLKPRPKFLE